MTVRDLLDEGFKILKENIVEDYKREAALILAWVLKKDSAFLHSHPEYRTEDREISLYRTCIKRRANKEPYAYITGECEFLSLKFHVNQNVLIPRPETELLAEAAMFALGSPPGLFNQPMFRLPRKKTYKMLDIGTGSGCLTISIAKKIRNVMVDALDVSALALNTARQNVVRHNVLDRVNLICADFLKDSLFSDNKFQGKYDLIVSNPPYIPSEDILTLMPEVKNHEPHNALDGGNDGLLFYRAIAKKADFLLRPHGVLAVECGFNQAEKVQGLFCNNNMETVSLKDLAGINRVVAARFRV
jgi:release factor glutamine methyltransferase